MADLRQFGIEEVGTPAPLAQNVAADTSEAIRITGQQKLFEGVVDASMAVAKSVDYSVGQKRVGELVAGENPELMSLQQIAAERARFDAGLNQGVSADRAKALASNRLRQAVAADPRRAEMYKKAYGNFFGEGGGGYGTFDKTELEKMQDNRVKYGFDKFNIDPAMFQNDPVAWENQFNQRLQLENQNNTAEAAYKQIELGQKLTTVNQQALMPAYVTNIMSNPESPNYLPSQIKQVMIGSGISEDGTFSAAASANSVMGLNNLKNQLRAQMKQGFGSLSVAEFDSIYMPINDQIENAIAFASGKMTAEALARENKIFNDAAIASVNSANPAAAAQLVGLNSLVANLSDIPPQIKLQQDLVARQIVNALPAITNTESPVNPGALVTNKAALNTFEQQHLKGAGAVLKGDDPKQIARAGEVVTMVMKDITANPEEVSSKTYAAFFEVLAEGDGFNKLPVATQEMVLTGMANGGMDRYLADTIQEWIKHDSPLTTVTFDTDRNHIVMVAKDVYDVKSRREAAQVNAKLGSTNVAFDAIKAMGLDASVQGILNPVFSALGMDVEESVPAPVNRDAVTTDWLDIRKMGQSNSRLKVLAERMERGIANEGHLKEWDATIAKYPTLRDMAVPELQAAIAARDAQLDTPATPEVTRPAPTPLIQEVPSGQTPEQIAEVAEAEAAWRDTVPDKIQNPTGKLYGADALARGRWLLGREPNAIEKRLIELEAYSATPYTDTSTRGVETVGFGQTRRYMDMDFEDVVADFVEQTKKLLPAYDTYPEYLQAELVQAAYRGDLLQSPTFRGHMRDENYVEAAAEFLRHGEYETTDRAQIKKRLEAVQDAVLRYSKERQANVGGMLR